MGQESAYVATATGTETKKETTLEDVFSQGFESISDIYGSYSAIQQAEASAEGKEADAAAREASLRTSQIMQQTAALQQAALDQQNKIMGIDKTAFFIGATLLGLGVVGGAVYLATKK